MSITTADIAELIRAANEADRLSPFEVKRLLNRSVATIRDMREQIGIPGSNRAKDVVIDLQVAAARCDSLPAAEVRDALLDAADVIIVALKKGPPNMRRASVRESLNFQGKNNFFDEHSCVHKHSLAKVARLPTLNHGVLTGL